MKSLNTLFNNNTNILSLSEMLLVKGGLADEDKDKDKKDKKKDNSDYQTIDTEFDFWPEPEEE